MLYLDDGRAVRLVILLVFGEGEDIYISVRAVARDEVMLERGLLLRLLAEFYCQCYNLDIALVGEVCGRLEAGDLRAYYVVVDGGQVEVMSFGGGDSGSYEELPVALHRKYFDFLLGGRLDSLLGEVGE